MKLLSQILNACHLTPFTVWLIQCCWFNDTFTYVSKPFAFCFVCFNNRQFALFSSIWTSISWSNTVSITHDEQRRKKKSIDLVHPLGSSCRHKLITFNFYFWSAVVITISIFSLYFFYFDHFKPWRFYRLSIIRTIFIDVHTLPFFRENIFKSEHGFWWANTFTDLWLKLVYCHWWIAQTTKKTTTGRKQVTSEISKRFKIFVVCSSAKSRIAWHTNRHKIQWANGCSVCGVTHRWN